MTGWSFTAFCLACGGPTGKINGTVRAHTESVAVAGCEACGAEFLLVLVMRPLRRPARIPTAAMEAS